MTTPDPTEAAAVHHHSQAIQSPRPASSNGLSATALVLGIVGAALCWVPVFGFILGILAATIGAIDLVKVDEGEATNKGMTIAGLVLGVFTMAFWPLLLIIAAPNVPAVPSPPL